MTAPSSRRPSSGRVVWIIARRFLRGRRSRLLTGTARSALGSMSLGVMAMVTAMALMNGYTESVQERMLQSGALILMPTPLGAVAEEGTTPEQLAQLPEVDTVTYAVFAQGAMISDSRKQGLDVFLRGVVPGQGLFGGTTDQLATGADGVAGVLLGRDLAARLEVGPGDLVKLVVPDLGSSPVDFSFRTARVSDTFSTGFAEFDRRYAVMSSAVVEALSAGPGLWEVAASPSASIDAVAETASELLGDRFLVRDWRRSNPGLFTALRLQKWVLFLVLGLIVVVSTFNVASTLVVLVRERTREVGVLASLGLQDRRLRQVFLVCGLVLGGAGTALGIGLGSALAWLLTELRLLRFDPGVAEIYFIDFVPFQVRIGDLGAIVLFSVAVTLLASWLPAREAARLEPASALRYE